MNTSLPATAYLPLNHCNLPAVILGSLTFQQHPVPLELDCSRNLHKEFFSKIQQVTDAKVRAEMFKDYMTVYFRINGLEHNARIKTNNYPRVKVNYLNMLRGWLFDSDSREGAVLKGWIESRFGLVPNWHKKEIKHPDDPQYQLYLHEKTTGIYNTNALESQLDLLYSYCQFELYETNKNEKQHLMLYRGTKIKTAKQLKENNNILLFNNLNSFSTSQERADEFGDITLEVKVPLAKVFFYSGLLPGVLQGEDENIIIGGLYKVKICSPYI